MRKDCVEIKEYRDQTLEGEEELLLVEDYDALRSERKQNAIIEKLRKTNYSEEDNRTLQNYKGLFKTSSRSGINTLSRLKTLSSQNDVPIIMIQ